MRTFCGQGRRGSSVTDVRTFGAKNFEFFEIYVWCVRMDKAGGRVESVRTFFGQGGGGQFFAILYGRPLWTNPYVLKHSSP